MERITFPSSSSEPVSSQNDNNSPSSSPPLQKIDTIASAADDQGPLQPFGRKPQAVSGDRLAAIDAMTTGVDDPEMGNAMSAMRECVQLEEASLTSRIFTIDGVMRNSIDLFVEIIEIQLAVINDLLAQEQGRRNFKDSAQKLKEGVNELKKLKLQDLDGLLDARKTMIEDGKEIPLTAAKKAEFKQNYLLHIDKVSRAIGYLDLNQQTNLEDLKKHLEEMKNMKLKTYCQLMDNKTDLAMDLFRLQQLAHDLYLKRVEWLRSEARDLWSASALGSLEVLKRCISQMSIFNKKTKINTLDSQGRAPIHIAAIYGQLDALNILLENKADPNLRDSEGYTPLHWAAKIGCVTIAQRLLSCKAIEIDAHGAYDRTPLHMCVYNGSRQTGSAEHIAITKLLLDRGADINSKTNADDGGKTPLLDAVILNCLPMVLVLMERPLVEVMASDKEGRTALYHAVFNRSPEIVALLVGHQKWKTTRDPQSPNHRNQLIRMTEENRQEKNKEEILEFLRNLKE